MNDEPDLIYLNEFSTVWGPLRTGGPGQTAPVAPPVGGTGNNLHWTELVQTILHSEFHSDRAYSRSRKSSNRFSAKMTEFFLPKLFHFEDRTACCIHSISLISVPQESLFHALFKKK